MRLWHKDLISVLPKNQLMGQWRECCLIAKNIADKGTPNHILVNKIMDYSLSHFFHYAQMIEAETLYRGYRCDFQKFFEHFRRACQVDIRTNFDKSEVFCDWHNDRYFIQCVHNLEEKYDCGGITAEEWGRIEKKWFKWIEGDC